MFLSNTKALFGLQANPFCFSNLIFNTDCPHCHLPVIDRIYWQSELGLRYVMEAEYLHFNKLYSKRQCTELLTPYFELLNNKPLLDKLRNYTILNHFTSIFFLALRNSFNISAYARVYVPMAQFNLQTLKV